MIEPVVLFLHRVSYNPQPHNHTSGMCKLDWVRTWGQAHQIMQELESQGYKPMRESVRVGLIRYIIGRPKP